MIFSFKSKDKLKKEILKELQTEMKKEKEKEEMKKLNKSISSLPVTPPKKVNNSKEDLKDIQMKFLKLSVFLLFLALAFVLLFIYSDTIFGGKKNDTNSTSNINNGIDVEEKEEVKIETKNLVDLEDGKIDLSNSNLEKLYYMFGNYTYDYFLIDTTFLYKNNKTLVNNLANEQILFLMSRTKEFKELLEKSKLTTESQVCNNKSTIKINKSDIDNILLNRFNKNNLSFDQFNSSYYVDNQFITYIKFTLNNDLYTSSCFKEVSLTPNIITESLVYSAEKKSNTIYIDLKTVFISQDGIYKDYNLKTRIRDLVSNGDNLMEYVSEGSSYRATFKENANKDYYFYSMEKID